MRVYETPCFYVRNCNSIYIVERFVMGHRQTLEQMFKTRADAQLAADKANKRIGKKV